MTASFQVYGIPKPQGSMRAIAFKRKGSEKWSAANVQGGSDEGREALASWRGLMSHGAIKAMRGAAPIAREVPVCLRLTFYVPRPKSKPRHKFPYPTTKPDVDKLLRAALDAFSGVIYEDDSQIIGPYPRKLYADDRAAGLDVEVWTL